MSGRLETFCLDPAAARGKSNLSVSPYLPAKQRQPAYAVETWRSDQTPPTASQSLNAEQPKATPLLAYENVPDHLGAESADAEHRRDQIAGKRTPNVGYRKIRPVPAEALAKKVGLAREAEFGSWTSPTLLDALGLDGSSVFTKI